MAGDMHENPLKMENKIDKSSNWWKFKHIMMKSIRNVKKVFKKP